MERVRSRRFILWAVAGTVVVLLVAARLALPHVVKRYVNHTLQGLNGYSGSVADIDISLWRGAYQIEGLNISKTDGKVPIPFVSARLVDLSVQWRALLHRSIVAKIELYDPKVNFVAAKQPAKRQAKVDKSWTDTARSLVPFEINHVGIHHGQVHYRDLESNPRVDVFVQQLDATVRNLTNTEKFGKTLYASFDGRALAMGSGKVRFHGRLDPYAKQPTFAFAFSMNDLELKQLNAFLKAYADVDAEAGTFSLDTELAAHGGKFDGYVKPFVKNLKVLNWSEEHEGFFRKLWEGTVQVVGDVLENHSSDRIATRIPFSGTVKDPNAELLPTIAGLLKNAFLTGLKRGLEGGVQLPKGALSERGNP